MTSTIADWYYWTVSFFTRDHLAEVPRDPSDHYYRMTQMRKPLPLQEFKTIVDKELQLMDAKKADVVRVAIGLAPLKTASSTEEKDAEKKKKQKCEKFMKKVHNQGCPFTYTESKVAVVVYRKGGDEQNKAALGKVFTAILEFSSQKNARLCKGAVTAYILNEDKALLELNLETFSKCN